MNWDNKPLLLLGCWLHAVLCILHKIADTFLCCPEVCVGCVHVPLPRFVCVSSAVMDHKADVLQRGKLMEHCLPITLVLTYQAFNASGGRANDNTAAFLTTKPQYKGQPGWIQDIAHYSELHLAKHANNAILPK